MSVLAFVFDHLLLGNINQSNGTPPISKVARAFLQCLAAIQYPLGAILILVTEFKLAFSRALLLPESQLKHMRVRALTSLLSQILDSQNNSLQSRAPVNPSHFSRMLIRKGFISDLSRATHSLSLNSSHLVGTVNNILKPLEVLTRIVNQVASGQRKTGADSAAAKLATATSGTQTSTAARQTSQTSQTALAGTGLQGVPTAATPATTTPAVSSQSPSSRTEQQQRERHHPEGSSAARNTHPALSTVTSHQEDHATDTSFLEATHESLIPLEEEEEDEGEREQRHEIISLAQELGRQHREELTVAGSGDMDIQVEVSFLGPAVVSVSYMRLYSIRIIFS